jgi:hypothetical protein
MAGIEIIEIKVLLTFYPTWPQTMILMDLYFPRSWDCIHELLGLALACFDKTKLDLNFQAVF